MNHSHGGSRCRSTPHPVLRARTIAAASHCAAPRSSPEPEAFEPAADRVAVGLVAELSAQADGRRHPISTIRRQVHRAIADLRGSVTLDALPEMAARLVRHRLANDDGVRMPHRVRHLVLPEQAALAAR